MHAVPVFAPWEVRFVRSLMWFALGFAGASAIGAYWFSPWLWIPAVAALSCFLTALILKRKWRWMRIPAAVALGISLGVTWFLGYRHVFLSPLTQWDGRELYLTAEISDYSTTGNYSSTVDAEITVNGRNCRGVLYLKETKELKPGDKVSGTFRLRLTHEGLEGNTYHRGNGTFLLAYASEEVTVTPTGKFPLKHAPAVLRAGILQRLDALFPRDTAFFAKALLLGDRSDVDYETNTAFKLSGISHIIAVSGLHVSILFSVVFLLTGKRRILTALFGIPVLVLFAAVTGFSPSVTRACVMQLLMILATLVDQEYDPPTALSAAVLLMLLVNPLVITAASFQLSVGCMAGIFLFSEKIQRWLCGLPFWSGWKGRGLRIRIRNWLTSGAAVTLSAMFFTMPLVAYYFGCISLVSVLTNLLTLWAVSWIFYGIMAVCLLSLLWNQGAVGVAWLISWLISA